MKITVIGVTEIEGGVRSIPRNYRAVTGRVETLRGQTVPYESTLERDFAHLLDFNARVASITSQPMCIQFLDNEGMVRTYTPDYLVRFRPIGEHKPWRTTLYEVKYREELQDRWQELLPGFLAARQVCRSRGWNFRLVTERFIRNAYLENVQFLRDYRSYPDNGIQSQMLLNAMQELKTSTPAQLLAATFMDLTNRMEAVGVLWRLVTSRAIGANLMVKLTMASEIWHEEPVLHGNER